MSRASDWVLATAPPLGTAAAVAMAMKRHIRHASRFALGSAHSSPPWLSGKEVTVDITLVILLLLVIAIRR